jgi:alpha-glucosidase (family GH31 glycosyl hydrolase)
MPDMIGGNQYDNDRADKELLIRWAQASALMPLIQFSVGPWHFDEQAVKAARKASQQHIQFSPLIIQLARQAPKTGEPILAPLWWHAPKDPATHDITDQFMIGPDLVVAPVVKKGAVARDVYLPAGKWRDTESGKVVDGGWLRGHPAPLEVLPLFVREGSAAEKLALKK